MSKKMKLSSLQKYRMGCRCPVCGKIAEVDVSRILTTFPPQYGYHCDHCGHNGSIYCTDCYLVTDGDEEYVEEEVSGEAPEDVVDIGGDFGNLDYSKVVSDEACMTVNASELCINKPDWPTSLKGYCKCQRCGGDAELFKESFEATVPEARRRYHCKKCGAYGYTALENVYYLKAEEDR